MVPFAVDPDGLGDLLPHPLHGVQGVLRALEDNGGSGPPHGPQASGLHGQHVLALEEDLTLGAGARRQQPQQRHRHRRLAATGLARHAHGLAAVDIEVDAPHRGHVTSGAR